jgi:hypothetical protein
MRFHTIQHQEENGTDRLFLGWQSELIISIDSLKYQVGEEQD